MNKTIIIDVVVNNSLENVWNAWNEPEHIVNWYFASPEWHCPKADIDLQIWWELAITLAAKDGSMSFDLKWKYSDIQDEKYIAYTLEDGRKVTVWFEQASEWVKVTETFEPEKSNSEEMQQQGWMAILNNFKTYGEKI